MGILSSLLFSIVSVNKYLKQLKVCGVNIWISKMFNVVTMNKSAGQIQKWCASNFIFLYAKLL